MVAQVSQVVSVLQVLFHALAMVELENLARLAAPW